MSRAGAGCLNLLFRSYGPRSSFRVMRNHKFVSLCTRNARDASCRNSQIPFSNQYAMVLSNLITSKF